MFAVTYLGQQGWLVRGDRAHVLVDPLLTDEYSPGFAAVIDPPRSIALAAMPPIDAIVLSHEHADHVSLPSLAGIDRRVPVVMPARAASTIRDAITALGFRVVPGRAGDRFSIGDLALGYHGNARAGSRLDWEVTCLQIHVAGRDGSFFTYVDTWPDDATLAGLGPIGVFVHANNTMDWSCLELGGVTAPSTLEVVAELAAAEATWWRGRTAPELTTIVGPGLAFHGRDAWMNQILTVRSDDLCAALAAAAPNRRYRAPAPGETVELRAGRVVAIRPRAPFVRPVRRRPGPRRLPARRALLTDFEPACGERSIAPAEWSPLLAGLGELAAYLYRRELFHALLAADGAPRPAEMALVLRCDRRDLAHVFAYRPEACRFERVECHDPLGTYAVGLECWASDLVRVLVGRQLPQRLLGHLRTWSALRPPLSPLFAVWGFFDALHRPAAAAAFYGELAARLADQEPVVAAGRGRLRRAR